jgi:DNA-binding CsgD family transcriptional regulator
MLGMVPSGTCGTIGCTASSGISDVALQFLDVFEIPLFLFTADATVAWLNTPARRLLKRIKLNLNTEGVIRPDGFPTRKAEAILASLRDEFRTAHGWKDGPTEVVLSGLPNTLLHFCRLDLDGEAFIACVPTVQHKPDHLLSRLSSYGLTETEKKIASQLIKGQTVSEIASRNGNTVLTVRTHIKHIYSKIGVNSREKMFAHLVNL